MHWSYCSLALSHWYFTCQMESSTVNATLAGDAQEERWSPLIRIGVPALMMILFFITIILAYFYPNRRKDDEPQLKILVPTLVTPSPSRSQGHHHRQQVYWSYWCIWVRSRNCGCLVTWFCYQLKAEPGNKTATVSWPDPYIIWHPWTESSLVQTMSCHIVAKPLPDPLLIYCQMDL